MRSIIFCGFFLLLTVQNFAQTKIVGHVIDSTHNNLLQSVSVAIYEKGKETVDKVGLTDRFGKFEIDDLDINKQFIVEFTFLGYRKAVREFVLKKDEKKDFGHINMPFIDYEIDAVDVAPPVRMNGDTIEFNADAFQLDSNAVVEDLLRRLPGLVVWGDGAVTYNGREIPNVLVNGKPFFGNDMATAIQNIDKNSVKKVQVYDRRTLEEKQKDPDNKQYEMNVVLKEGKERILFGNVGAGGGTNDRYQGQANLNHTNGKAQATFAYAVNNVNKDLNGTDQLLKNTTYKGVGINADFDSDFLRSGIIQQNVLGGRYQYDFLNTKEVGKQKLLSVNALSKWNNAYVSNESSSQLLDAVEGQQNSRAFSSVNNNDLRNHFAEVFYNNTEMMLGKRALNIRSRLDFSNYNNRYNSTTETSNYLPNNQSINNLDNLDHHLGNNIAVFTSLELHGKAGKNMISRGNSDITYWDQIRVNLTARVALADGTINRYKRGNFENLLDTNLNRFYDRTYDESNSSKNLNLDLKIQDQNNVVLGNKLNVYRTNDIHEVLDKLIGSTSKNDALSRYSNQSLIDYQPYLEYSRRLKYKNLYGRMYSNLSLSSTVAVRFFSDRYTSTLDYRNVNLNYASLLPTVKLNYTYSKQSSYYANLSLQYNYNEQYPQLNQLFPIYDDINPSYRYFGANRLLDKTGVHQLQLNGNYYPESQYGMNVSATLSYKRFVDGLTDSTVYAQNQQQHYLTQVNKPMDLFTIDLNVEKPYLISKTQTFSVKLNTATNLGNKYQYVNNLMQEMLTNTQSVNLQFYYTLLDKYQVGWTNRIIRYERYDKSKVLNSNNYTSYNYSSGLSMSYAITKKWSVNTNATGRYNKSGNFSDHAIIWNANTSYRMMKGNNLELKFAAFDLLRQNKGIYFNNGLTEFTTGYRNILTQYYMLSISYYPRKFGSTSSK